MVFHEIYGVYFLAVAQLITLAQEGQLTEEKMREVSKQIAFAESEENMPSAILDQKWALITADGKTPIRHSPKRPPTTLERRWLKAILQDPRIHLFNPAVPALEGVEPLFSPEDYLITDQYADRDPYESAEYRHNFQMIRKALGEKKWLSVDMLNQAGKHAHVYILPEKLEYAMRDDKFRVLCSEQSEADIINVARVQRCEICDLPPKVKRRRRKSSLLRTLVLQVKDERNGLERVMTHFSMFDKTLTRVDETTYRLTLTYHTDEESDLLLQVLSFGPVIQVISPESLKKQVRERIERQLCFRL